MKSKTKKAAAVAAVTAYIRDEEEALWSRAADVSNTSTVEPGLSMAAPPKLWGVSGRHMLMLMRNQMQLKSYHRPR